MFREAFDRATLCGATHEDSIGLFAFAAWVGCIWTWTRVSFAAVIWVEVWT